MSDNGWIKLHRSFLDWEWYTCPNASRLFIHCLLKANHKDGKHQGEPVPRGTFLTSLELLSQQTGLSIKCIRTSLKHLESTGEIGTERARKGTRLSICKYDTYQNIELVKGTPEGKQGAQEGHGKGTGGATNKKEKNTKEQKEIPKYIDSKLWADFLDMRMKKKAINSDRALNALLNKLEDIEKQLAGAANAEIERSLINSWKSFYPEEIKKPKIMTNSERVAFILANEDRGNN